MVAGPMAEVNHNSLKYLSNQDLLSIATYLKTVKSEQPMGFVGTKLHSAVTRGRDVFFKACSTCHVDGQVGAPRIGDAQNWMMRLSAQQLPTLYRHAINGFNSMPYRGGCVTCTDRDVEAAVDYILHRTLTKAQMLKARSAKPKPKASRALGKEIYQQHCAVCHAKSHQGAPKVGDKKAWQPYLAKNFDELISVTLKGNAKMPPKGGCKHCSSSEVIAAIKYMANESSDRDYSLW